ncbi:TPA: DUF1190 domain-containing protein [Vibrio vulnificus]|nr:DUF1190 domain-containing protein [Vibrio vulnificus]HAU8260275.1 DUF1190 domain-containing protein [Vibrio vulnificus]HDY7742928.1 DUF1190 domain-containing protein [Vibrio vulnificus]HDY7779694.1 DUF1190 domain-containing protein [Vibrio vulnificus]
MKRSSNVKKSSFEKIMPAIPYVLFGGFFAYTVYEPETEGYIFKDADHCKRNNPEFGAQCDLAYQEALARAEYSAPKYSWSQACRSEFSDDECHYSSVYHSYIPRMNSFFYTSDTSGLKNSSKSFFSEPLYRYKHGYYSGSGVSYGSTLGKAVNINTSSLKSSGGTIGKVMSRGGFGHSVSVSRGG